MRRRFLEAPPRLRRQAILFAGLLFFVIFGIAYVLAEQLRHWSMQEEQRQLWLECSTAGRQLTWELELRERSLLLLGSLFSHKPPGTPSEFRREVRGMFTLPAPLFSSLRFLSTSSGLDWREYADASGGTALCGGGECPALQAQVSASSLRYSSPYPATRAGEWQVLVAFVSPESQGGEPSLQAEIPLSTILRRSYLPPNSRNLRLQLDTGPSASPVTVGSALQPTMIEVQRAIQTPSLSWNLSCYIDISQAARHQWPVFSVLLAGAVLGLLISYSLTRAFLEHVALRESDSAKELQAQSLRAANLQLKLAMEQSVEAERAKDEALQTQEQIARALERALTRTAEVNWELENANIRLRILNSELDDFTHVVSHDLKEPLRGMQAFAQFLLEDYSAQLDDVGRTYLTNIMSSAQRMQQLIQDLLELSRVSRKAARLEKTSARVALTAALEDLTYSIERRSAVIELPETDARVMADSAQLRSIFKNLISNAIKYNEQTVPTVRIDWRLDEGRWLVSVQDNGIGIDMRYHERIFELFERLVSRQQYEGTGAGLAITRKMVEQHGGKIWIESAPGQGSTFYFSLAVAAPEDNTESSQT